MSTRIAIKLVLVMLLWAICFPLITAGLEYAPHLTFAAMRAFLAGAALLALGAVFRRPLPSGARIWMLLALTGLGATTLAFLGMFHAAEYIAPGMATVIANTQPLMAAALAHAYLGEHLGLRGKVGLALAFAGIVIIASPELLSSAGASSALGLAYITLAAFGVTVSNVLIKHLAGTVDPLMAMGAQLVLGGVPLAVLAVLTEAPETTQWSAQFTLALLALAFLGTSLVYWLWFSLLESVELNKANAFTFLIPVFGVAMGIAFFGEQFSWQDALGAGLTVVGLDLVIRRRRAVGVTVETTRR
ncbi:MAG: DMT family transporter [Gammaproteobacteria bacterium]|nr:MAG: DMT family transporter [Gammaproteobacteria bacterium]